MRSKPMILAALLLAAFAVNLDTTLVNVALPSLVRELHATTTQLQWVVDAYNLVFAALLLTFGSLSDRLGRKGMLLAGLAVFGTASVAGGFTTSPGQLIAVRAVMGLGAAMTFPATLSLISNVFTGRAERARAIGLWGASARGGDRAGADRRRLAPGALQLGQHLRGHGPVAAAGALLVMASVPTSKDPAAAPVDVPGLVLSTGAMALLVFTIIEAPGYGWGSARSVAGFAVSAVLLAAFIVGERRSAHPMLDVRLFRNLRFSAASGAVTVAFFTLLGFIFLITQYFQFVRGYGPLSTGVHLLPVALAVGVGSVAGTQLAVRAGTKLVVAAGLVAMAAFYGWVAVATTATTSYGVICRADGRVRARDGAHLGAGHRVHHGRRGAAAGRHRFGGQRLDPPARRHAGRRGDRQCLRLPLRLTADQPACPRPCPAGSRPWPISRSARRTPCPARSARPGTRPWPGHPSRRHPCVPARPQHRLRGRRECRGGRRRGRRGLPARPAPGGRGRPAPGPRPGPRSSPGNPGRGQAESGFRFARLPNRKHDSVSGRSSWPLVAGARTIR